MSNHISEVLFETYKFIHLPDMGCIWMFPKFFKYLAEGRNYPGKDTRQKGFDYLIMNLALISQYLLLIYKGGGRGPPVLLLNFIYKEFELNTHYQQIQFMMKNNYFWS